MGATGAYLDLATGYISPLFLGAVFFILSSMSNSVLLAHGEVVAVGPPSEVLEASVLERAFGVTADIVAAPDGSPLVVPRLTP